MIAARDRLDRGAVALGGVIVVAANLLYLTGLPLILDPAPDMDPLYIEMAQHPIAHILATDPSWGPLYALWFKPFVAILGDPVAAYTANIYALSIAVTGLWFASWTTVSTLVWSGLISVCAVCVAVFGPALQPVFRTSQLLPQVKEPWSVSVGKSETCAV